MNGLSQEVFNPPYPGACAGVEECWMDFDGARMRYLRSHIPAKDQCIPLLAKDARNGAPKSPLPAKDAKDGAPTMPLILLHGLLGYSFSWRFTIPGLAPYFTVYAPDMMGAGFSDRPAGVDHSMRGTARRLLRFAERLGISSFDLVGTSHGGAVAMMAADECRSGNSRLRVRRLVLVAPVNPFSAHGRRLAPFVGSDVGRACFRVLLPQMNWLYPYWHGRMFADHNRIPGDSFSGYLAPLEKAGLFDHALAIVRTWTQDLRELKSILPKLAGIPTLLMWGGEDPAVYASSAEPLAKYFPRSRTVIFPGIGHLPYEECADEFNRVLIEFLTDVAAS